MMNRGKITLHVCLACFLLIAVLPMASCSTDQENQSADQENQQQWTNHTIEGGQELTASGVSFRVADNVDCSSAEDAPDSDPYVSSGSFTDGKYDFGYRLYTFSDGVTKDLHTYYYDGVHRFSLWNNESFPFTFKNGDTELRSSKFAHVESRVLPNGTNIEYYDQSSEDLTPSQQTEGNYKWWGMILGYDETSGKGFAFLLSADVSGASTSEKAKECLPQGLPSAPFDALDLNFDPDLCTADSLEQYSDYHDKFDTEASEKSRQERAEQEKADQEREEKAKKKSESSSSSNTKSRSAAKDEVIVDTNGKRIYKVEAAASNIHFSGSYTGTGNFIIEVLNSNQNLYELVTNEIGDYVVDKSVSVTPGVTYYIQIECSYGSWSMSWTGTGGQ